MIVPGSRYGYQSAACGTITSDTCDGGGYQWITFGDGYSNCYEFADYQECSLAEAAKTCWYVGERVMIVPGSRYGYQSAACGTITYDTCDGGGYQWITFDDGYSNCYEFADYQECSLVEAAKTCWYVGERVMIVPGSRYGYQSAACG